MAAITPVLSNLVSGVKRVFWETINEDDTGAAITSPVPGHAYAVVVFDGTFNGGVLTLEESVDDGATWNEAVSLGGDVAAASDLDFSAVGSAAVVVQAGAQYRIANDANGTSEDVDVTLYLMGIGG